MLIDEHTVELLKSTIEKNGWLELPAFGNSMFPLIQEGNFCRFVPFTPSSVKKGDIILYSSHDDQLVAHRFVGEKNSLYLLKGDTNLGFDQPVKEKQIVGKLISIQKRHLKITSDHFLAYLWGRLLLRCPVLSWILRKYLNRKISLQF